MSFTLSQSLTSYDLILYPSSDNLTALNIYPTSPTTHFDKVDDVALSPNDDTDYVYASTGSVPAIIDMYNLTNHTTETGTINYVRVSSRVRSHLVQQSPTGSYKHKVTSGAGNSLSGEYAPVNTAYMNLNSFFMTDPATSAPWTWSAIDALKAGISVSSPLVSQGTGNVTLRPNANGTYGQFTFTGANWDRVDEEVCDNLGTYDKTLFPTLGPYINTYLHESFTTTGAPIKVTVYFAAMGNHNTTPYERCAPYLKLGANEVYGVEIQPPDSAPGIFGLFSESFTTKPGGGAWTWTDVNNLEIGLRARAINSGAYQICLSQIYIVVDYNLVISPEIRTTQLYVVVNYTPSPLTVSLLEPVEVNLSNTRRSERFIFPDGTYCIGDYGRAGKKLSMKGTEVTTAITKMRAIQEMLQNPSPVTISGLSDVNQDIAWRLQDFNYEYDSSGDHYDWSMELAAYDVVV